jgi:hypothetical protein
MLDVVRGCGDVVFLAVAIVINRGGLSRVAAGITSMARGVLAGWIS